MTGYQWFVVGLVIGERAQGGRSGGVDVSVVLDRGDGGAVGGDDDGRCRAGESEEIMVSEELWEGPLPDVGPGFRLEAEDLFDRFGFGDGDILDMYPETVAVEFAAAAGLTVEELYELDTTPALRWLVREALLPWCPEGTELYDIESLHNPIRCAVWPGWVAEDLLTGAVTPPADAAAVAVTVSWEVAGRVIRHLRTVSDVNSIVGQ